MIYILPFLLCYSIGEDISDNDITLHVHANASTNVEFGFTVTVSLQIKWNSTARVRANPKQNSLYTTSYFLCSH